MTFAQAATTRSRPTSGADHGARWCGRRAGRRAALLLVVWAIPAVWCAGHQLLHAHEADDAGSYAAVSVRDRIAGMSERRGHGHTHPDESLALTPAGVKKVAFPAILAAAAELEVAASTLWLRGGTVLTDAAWHKTAASGPRAPPIA